ncbi:MAG TPA: glycoside hydrolase family 2 TIM barrel-domain containing protein, partial [Bacillota bacterium]|nr:glycoside hydrolase family 2 TIM barrel-domain containing protein [Bacillota bacterium]
MKQRTLRMVMLFICLIAFWISIPDQVLHAAVTFNVNDIYNGNRGCLFNDNWQFFPGDAVGAPNLNFNDSDWQPVNLPHDWSISFPFNPDSPAGAGGGYLDGGIGWYRKSFNVPRSHLGKRLTIGFDGVYMNSEVWINGHFLGKRPYGYVSFEYNLTPYLNYGGRNILAVRVDNNQPNSRWYSGSGIYRNVWLTVTEPVCVAYCGMFVNTPSVNAHAATINVSTKILNRSDRTKPVVLATTLLDAAGHKVAFATTPATTIPAQGETTYSQNLTLRQPRLWSTVDPYQYTARTQVIVGNAVTDTFRTTFGVRTFAMDANNGFFLNGVGLKLQGVNLHHDLGSLGAAVNYRAMERQLEIMQSMGCNAIRTSHNPPDPALLEICDRLGLLVIDEAFDCWREGNKNPNDYHLYFEDWAETDIRSMVRRDRNHPSVIMYSIGNEVHDVLISTGIPDTKNLLSWIRQEDTTRIITHGSNFNAWGHDANQLLDSIGYNYGANLYDDQHRQFPHWKMYGSETSSAVRTRGVYKLPLNQNILTDSDSQCSSYDNSVVPWGSSAEQSYQDTNSRKFVAGEFIWTGFDYIGEPTPYTWPAKSSYFGIVDTCGFPKDIFYFYQSRWTAKPMLHLLPHWNWAPGQTIPVWAYTNCDSVELFINGRSLGSKKFITGGPLHLEW